MEFERTCSFSSVLSEIYIGSKISVILKLLVVRKMSIEESVVERREH